MQDTQSFDGQSSIMWVSHISVPCGCLTFRSTIYTRSLIYLNHENYRWILWHGFVDAAGACRLCLTPVPVASD